MKQIGPILGFHLISETDTLAQSDPPNLVSLQLEHSTINSSVGSIDTTLIMPILETLELKYCVDVNRVMVSPKLVNLSILTTYTDKFEVFLSEPNSWLG